MDISGDTIEGHLRVEGVTPDYPCVGCSSIKTPLPDTEHPAWDPQALWDPWAQQNPRGLRAGPERGCALTSQQVLAMGNREKTPPFYFFLL